jgi:hypothetical protein
MCTLLVANMYFVLFGYNSVAQAQLLLKDLKFAQYAHLAPRAVFVMQMVRLSCCLLLSCHSVAYYHRLVPSLALYSATL